MKRQQKLDQPMLIFFRDIEEKNFKKPELASSLQSIETALLLIGNNRWPNTLTLLWEATEKLLKIHLRSPNLLGVELQEKYFKQENISKNLNDLVTKFRKERNKIVHEGYSPRDNGEVIKCIFNCVIPYLDHIFVNIFDDKLFTIVAKNPDQEWIKNIYDATRRVVTAKINRGDDAGLATALIPLSRAFKSIDTRSNGSCYTFSISTVEWELTENWQDLAWKIEEDLYREHVARMSQHTSECHRLESTRCHVCQKCSLLISGDFERDAGKDFEFYRLVCLTAVGCWYCQFIYSDRDICKEMFEKRLTIEDREILGHPQTPDAALTDSWGN